MHSVDDRPRPIWHVKLPPEGFKPCLMQDAPLSSFVCSQTDVCGIPCLQKLQQAHDPEGARELYERMRKKVHSGRSSTPDRCTTFGVLVYGTEEEV